MRRGRGIAQKHNVLVVPLFTKDAREPDPCRATDVAGIGHQAVTIEMGMPSRFLRLRLRMVTFLRVGVSRGVPV